MRNPDRWIDDNIEWLLDWWTSRLEVSEPIIELEGGRQWRLQAFASWGGDDESFHRWQVLTSAVFSREGTPDPDSLRGYTMPGFAEMAGRLPTPDDDVTLLVYDPPNPRLNYYRLTIDDHPQYGYP